MDPFFHPPVAPGAVRGRTAVARRVERENVRASGRVALSENIVDASVPAKAMRDDQRVFRIGAGKPETVQFIQDVLFHAHRYLPPKFGFGQGDRIVPLLF